MAEAAALTQRFDRGYIQGMEIGFPEALTAVGLLLIAAATASGLVHRTILSITVLSVGAGIALQATGVLVVEPGAHTTVLVAELVLPLTLFSDGLLVEPTDPVVTSTVVAAERVPALVRHLDVAARTIVAHGLTDTVGASWIERRMPGVGAGQRDRAAAERR